MVHHIEILLLTVILSEFISSGEVYVSRNTHSNDTESCGSTTKPCATIGFAVKIAKNFDTVLLDRRYEFPHQAPLCIDKNLRLTSYIPGNEQNEISAGTITFHCHSYPRNIHLFKVSANFSIDNLTMTVNQTCMNLIACIFKLNKDSSHYNFNIKNCTFNLLPLWKQFYIIDPSSTNANISILIDLSNIKTMSLYDAKRHSRTFYERTHWTDTSLPKPFITIEIRNSIIDGGFEVASNTLFINNCHFLGALFEIVLNPEGTYMLFRNYFTNSSLLVKYYSTFPTSLKLTKLTVKQNDFIGSLADYPQLAISSEPYRAPNFIVDINRCNLKNATHGALYLETSGTIRNTFFISNTVVYKTYIAWPERAGALTVIEDWINIVNCTFINNSASNQPGSIKFFGATEQEIVIKNTAVESGTFPRSRENTVVLISPAENMTRMRIYNATIKCPRNEMMFYEQNVHYFAVICTKCDSTTYNSIDRVQLSWGKPEGFEEHNVKCYPCPYQASCIDGIKSKGNYWGYSNSSGAVRFVVCPPSYCCSSLANCRSYNTCINNRQGRLCGDCKAGHSISLFGPNRCVNTENCKKEGFWAVYTVAVFVFSLFLMYYKDVLKMAKKIINRTNQQSNQSTEDLDSITSETYTPILLHERMKKENEKNSVRIKEKVPSSATVSAILKIAFFFYQTASILRIEASAKTAYHVPYVIGILSSLFNVKIDSFPTNITDICLIETTSVAAIEFFRISIIFACLLLFVIGMIVCCIILNIRRMLSKEPTQTSQQRTKSFLNRLKGSYVQLLLIGYSSIAVFCLRAVHCVDIDGQPYLYIQAETVKCFQPWQKAVIGVVFTWVVPFPFILYAACRSLRSHRTTPNQFMVTLICPPVIFYFVARQCLSPNSMMDDQMDIETENILSILNEPFQYTDLNKRLIWEPVLLFRRLLLIVVTTFITSPVEKLYPAGVLLFIFWVHDFVVQPFSSNRSNFIQLISMVLLVVLTLVNTFWAYSNDIDFMQNKHFHTIGSLFLYSEVFILLLPFLIAALLVIIKIGNFIYKYFHSKQD